MWNHNYFIYITTNSTKSTLYISVTNDICTRLNQHKENKATDKSFTGKYYCYYLVHYERFIHIEEAIAREKEIKNVGVRRRMH